MRLALLTARRIWDQAPHCAFTDLALFQGRLLCAFREADDHHAFAGTLRVLESTDLGATWAPCARLESPGEDVRDPKFVPSDQGLALVCGARRLEEGAPHAQVRTLLFDSADGRRWGPPRPIVDPQYWLWRLTRAPSGLALGVAYHAADPVTARLYATSDLVRFEARVSTLHAEGRPSEHALAFAPDGEAVCLLRRDPGSGLVGRARPPYRDWTWTDLGVRIGGPCLIDLGGALVACVRLHEPQVHTALCWLRADRGELEEALALPSGEDTSYAGMVLQGNDLLVSYYSAHEGPTAIYFARVEITRPESPG